MVILIALYYGFCDLPVLSLLKGYSWLIAHNLKALLTNFMKKIMKKLYMKKKYFKIYTELIVIQRFSKQFQQCDSSVRTL